MNENRENNNTFNTNEMNEVKIQTTKKKIKKSKIFFSGYKKHLINKKSFKWLAISFAIGLFFPPSLLLFVGILAYKLIKSNFDGLAKVIKRNEIKELDIFGTNFDLSKKETLKEQDRNDLIKMHQQDLLCNEKKMVKDVFLNEEDNSFEVLIYSEANGLEKRQILGKKDNIWVYKDKELTFSEINRFNFKNNNILNKNKDDEVLEKIINKNGTNQYQKAEISENLESNNLSKQLKMLN